MFEKPYFLLLLLLLPLFVFLIIYDIFLLKKRAKKIAGNNISNVIPYYSEGQKWIKLVLYSLGFIFVIFSLARPKWGTSIIDYKVKGRDVLVLLDVSNSMMTNDVVPSRNELAKASVSQLLDTESTDRIGLMVFSDESELLSPMTNDYSAVKFFLDSIYPGMLSEGGTNIGKAILRGIDSFEDEEQMSSKMILLITDGENLQGNLSRYLSLAKDKQIKVFTAGVGTSFGKPIPVKNNKGDVETYVKDSNDKIVVSRLNEKLLKLISKETNASYLGTIENKNFLVNAVNRINSVDKREQDKSTFVNKKDRYDIFLLPALILFCLGFILDQGKLISLKNSKFNWVINKNIFLLVLIPILFLLNVFIYPANNSNNTAGNSSNNPIEDINVKGKLFGRPNGGFWGNIDFKKGNFNKALENYYSAVNFLKKESLSKLYYNIGNVFYKLNDMRRAEKYYEESKTYAKNDKFLSSIYYNEGLVAFKNQNFQVAEESFKKAINYNDQDNDAKYNYVISKTLNNEANKNENNNDQKDNDDKKQNNNQNEDKSIYKFSKDDINRLLNALDEKEKDESKKKNKENIKKGIMQW